MKLKDAVDSAKTKEPRVIRKARKVGAKAHKGQIRKFDKEPYFKHPTRVASIVKKYKKSKEIDKLISAALLHDTLEDTNLDAKALKRKFGKTILSLVQELTSDKADMVEKGGKRKYLAHKTQNMSSWALVIKLADRLDNVSDFKTASPEFVKSYSKQTNYILDQLEKKRSQLSGTHKALIKDIRLKMAEVNEDWEISWKTGGKKRSAKERTEKRLAPWKKMLDGQGVKYKIKEID